MSALTAKMHERYSMIFLKHLPCKQVTPDFCYVYVPHIQNVLLRFNTRPAIFHRSRQQPLRSSSASTGGRITFGKMFLVAGMKSTTGSGAGNERR